MRPNNRLQRVTLRAAAESERRVATMLIRGRRWFLIALPLVAVACGPPHAQPDPMSLCQAPAPDTSSRRQLRIGSFVVVSAPAGLLARRYSLVRRAANHIAAWAPDAYRSPSPGRAKGALMAKGYWLTLYRAVSDVARLDQYARLAGPAIEAAGGSILARGTAARTFEGGMNQRSVVIEFASVEQAIAAYESPRYQAALEVLKGAAEREVRILEGVG